MKELDEIEDHDQHMEMLINDQSPNNSPRSNTAVHKKIRHRKGTGKGAGFNTNAFHSKSNSLNRSNRSSQIDHKGSIQIEALDSHFNSSENIGHMTAQACVNDKQKYFEVLEEQRVKKEKKIAYHKAVKTLPRTAMAQLGLEFDQFNPEAKCQMFIDKESAAHFSSDAESRDSNLNGSIQTQDSLEISAEQMCKVLELPSNKRSQEGLQKILPLFKKLDAFEKLQKLTSGGETIPDSFFTKILQICFVERYKKGQYVCHEGEKGDKFYINLHGMVQFLKNDMDKTKALTEMKNASEGANNSATLKSVGTDSQNKQGRTQSKRNSVGTFNPNALAKHITSPINAFESKFTSRPMSSRRKTTQNVAPGANRLSLKTASKLDPDTIQSNVQHETINSKVSKPEDQDKKNNVPEINLLVMKELGRGGTGGMFGELAIKNPQAGRAASVKCLKNCIFIVLCGRDYSRYMRRLVEKLDDAKIEFLKTIPIFQNWAKGTMRSFLNNIKPHTYHKGHKILAQGEHSNFIYIVNKGTVGVSIKVKKPFSDIDSSVTMLRQEKYKLKDQIHGIQRHTRETLDQQNCLIEGDGSGMMGATDGWPKMHQGTEMYKDRMEKHEQEHEEGILRQRLLVLDDKKDKISDAKRMYWNVDHRVTQLAAGQLFNEEGLIVKDSPSRYQITVTSEKAELWLISAFQLGKRVEMVRETRHEMTSLIKYKARQVYDLCRTQATWSLIDADVYCEFYKQVFHKKTEIQEDDTMILEDNANNKQVLEETQVFYRQARESYNDVRDKKPINEQGEEIKVTGRQKILKRNLELLHAKVEEMDQVGCAVDLHPLKKGNLPQMENKKRYHEVQRVVSPNKNKGQKAHKIFKDDEFISDAIAETNNYAKEISMGGQRAHKVSKKVQQSAPIVPKVKQTAALMNYEKQLGRLKNIEGGGSLVSGHTLDQRAVMKEIVKGYPLVTQQIQIHLRDLALQMKDANGQPIHRTSEMLLNQSNSDIDDYTKFEKQLYETFDKSPDPMQLIKILRRKLSLGSNGASNVKILEDMLQQEPLRKFVLFAKKCYLNNQMFDQISKIHGMQGNEQAVYKNDIEYQTQMNLRLKPLPPKKMSYFQQSLQQKHMEAQYQSRQQHAQNTRQSHMKFTNSINDRMTTRQHKIELTIKPMQLSQNQSSMLKQQPQTQNKTPIFESKELQKLFSSTEQLKQLTTPPQNDKDPRYLSQGPNESYQNGKSTVSLEIQKQDDLIKMIENDPQTESILIMSEDQRDNNTARITYQGDNKSSIDNDTVGLLDVKLVQADLKVKNTQVSSFHKDSHNVVVATGLSALDQSVAAIMKQETRRQSQPLFTGPISANFQIKRPATSLLQRQRQTNCVSPIAGSTLSGRTSQLNARQIATHYGITNVNSGRQQIQHQQHTAQQIIAREGVSAFSNNNQRMASQLNHRPVVTRSSGQYMVQSSGLESSNMQSEANLSRLNVRHHGHRNQAQIASAKSYCNIYAADNRKSSQSRIGKRMPSTSMLDNLTATSSANYSRTGRMASQLNYHSKPKHIKMQVASLRKRAN